MFTWGVGEPGWSPADPPGPCLPSRPFYGSLSTDEPTPTRKPMLPHGRPAPDALPPDDALTRHNVTAESFFSAFNGIYMGIAILAAPVVAVTGVQASPLELTI